MQRAGSEVGVSKGMVGTLRNIYAVGGLSGLFKGAGTRVRWSNAYSVIYAWSNVRSVVHMLCYIPYESQHHIVYMPRLIYVLYMYIGVVSYTQYRYHDGTI